MDGVHVGWADCAGQRDAAASHSGATVVVPRVEVCGEATTEEEQRDHSGATQTTVTGTWRGGMRCDANAMHACGVEPCAVRETRDVNRIATGQADASTR